MNSVLNLILMSIFFLLFVFIVSSYENSSIIPEVIMQNKEITFTENVKPIFKKRCSTCHNNKQMPGKNWENYNEAFKYRYNINARVVIMKNMPPGNVTKITEEERNIIKDWVSQGSKLIISLDNN